jgi:hypothetical protein
VSKEVCKRVPVKEEANMEVEKCTRFPKEVSRRKYLEICSQGLLGRCVRTGRLRCLE